jgi:hypothetical protein
MAATGAATPALAQGQAEVAINPGKQISKKDHKTSIFCGVLEVL